MLNARLLREVDGYRVPVALHVGLQWVSLLASLAFSAAVTYVLGSMIVGTLGREGLGAAVAVCVVSAVVRAACQVGCARAAHLASREVRRSLRERMYRHVLALGGADRLPLKTSELVQVFCEGVDQLDSYFSAYLPQFFYAMLAPLTLFCVLAPMSLPVATVLLVCVPLIPVTIAAVQTWAKRLLGEYWGQYTQLGDVFLENLQGLTTSKVFGTDGLRHERMNEQAESFRRITMRVLSMQLNSIAVMDLVAFGGACAGTLVAVWQCAAGELSAGQCLFAVLVAADYFIPMRLLGSFFHIAMNGVAAADKMFALIDAPVPGRGRQRLDAYGVELRGAAFAYGDGPLALDGVDLRVAQGGFAALVGESGSGKSTVASLVRGVRCPNGGSVRIGGVDVHDVDPDELARCVAYVGHEDYLFNMSVRDNLCMARADAGDGVLWDALRAARADGFVRDMGGLDAVVAPGGANLSGGQRQRLSVARALLRDAGVYIFDEATSAVDVESEDAIMRVVCELAEAGKTVLLITHRLASAAAADVVYVMEAGHVVEAGTSDELRAASGAYARMWAVQQELEKYVEGGERDEA